MSLAILRAVLVFHALAVFMQAALAGQFLSGSDSSVRFHELTGWITLAVCLAQIIMAAVLIRSRTTSLGLVLGSIVVFLAEGLQVGTGYGRFLDVHVPLGAIIFAAVSWQAVSSFLRLPVSGAPAK
jgi:hypothetical protein